MLKGKKTELIDMNGDSILVGDRFKIKKHFNECCNHYVICEVKEDKNCLCGFGLFDIKTNKLICNAEIAGGYPKI